MTRWNASPHPISDIRDWMEAGRLELRPDFQRRAVWSNAARIMLMDTILRGVPIPKIYVATAIREDKSYRVVIDGQQRISAILDFLRGEFALTAPYQGPEEGKKFDELSKECRDDFLSYKIDFDEARNPTEDEVREVYSRVNKYTVPLNKQELRRADFPGDFLRVSETLADAEYFESAGLFAPSHRRRYVDVEYVSELLAGLLAGPQDKKSTLDEFYIQYAKWGKEAEDLIVKRFNAVLTELSNIFDAEVPIRNTRFRQRADFYSLFLALDDLRSNELTSIDKECELLRDDLKLLDEHIAPETDIPICREYAVKCVSQANSSSSRRWRQRFLTSVLQGTFSGYVSDTPARVLYYQVMEWDSGQGMCPPDKYNCPVCDGVISGVYDDCVLAWGSQEAVQHISNAKWIHRKCVEDSSSWLVLERADRDEQSRLF